MKKKNAIILVILIVIIVAILALLAFKNNKKVEAPTPVDNALNEAVQKDDLKSINENLNKIDTSDTIDQDLKAIDEDLKNL